ncbi:MAG: hypothetical protein ABIA93_01280 [Candidatus Woesearchaeota archaeon]
MNKTFLASWIFLAVIVFSVQVNASCIDGTLQGACSSITGAPWYCNASDILVENAIQCGCPEGLNVRQDGSCTLYPHIKLFNFVLEPSAVLLSADNIAWKASHNDFIFTRGNVNTARQANPSVHIVVYRNMQVLTETEQATAVPQFCLANGCDPEAVYMHYKTDTFFYYFFGNATLIPGYNPDWAPGDLPASATLLNQSRAPDMWKSGWVLANLNNQGWEDYNYKYVVGFLNYSPSINAILIDNGDFNPEATRVNRTIEYWGSPLNGNNPLIELYFEKQNALRERATSELGMDITTVTNARATYWYLHPWFYQGYLDLVPAVQIETWLQYRNSASNTDNVYFERDYFENQRLLNDSLNGKAFFLTAYEKLQPGTPRSKMFLLSAFYLINNPNLYFVYTDYSDEWFAPDGTVLSVVSNYTEKFWIPAVEVDVGQPTQNHFNLPDYAGQYNTPYQFELITGTDPALPARTFHIIAREYENALVLVKWRPTMSNVDNTTRTTHVLDGMYYPVNEDGTIGTATNSVTLRNNEGAILLKDGSWVCTDWGECLSSSQTRTCTCEGGYCAEAKPVEQQACMACSVPNDEPPCDCISNAELSTSIDQWFMGTLGMTDMGNILLTRLNCAG